jgi:hypothetical protein
MENKLCILMILASMNVMCYDGADWTNRDFPSLGLYFLITAFRED